MQSKDDVIEVWKVNYEILKLTLFIAIDFMELHDDIIKDWKLSFVKYCVNVI